MEISQSYSLKDKEFNAIACFNLMAQVIEECFTKSGQKFKKSELNFLNSKVFFAFCDCSSNFVADKLKYQVATRINKQISLYGENKN